MRLGLYSIARAIVRRISLILFSVIPRAIGYFLPRTYIRSRRILLEQTGVEIDSTGLFAIYAVRPEGKIKIDGFILDALSAMRGVGINVWVVSNRPLSDSQLMELRRFAARVIVRDGSGRDFGSYKDGMHEILERNDVRRLLLFNDSVYVIPSRAQQFFTALMEQSDAVVGATESFERAYHLQSFAISIPEKILRDPLFAAYWNNYLPITDRRYTIQRGEFGLSRRFREMGVRIEALYNLSELEDKLDNLGPIFFFDQRALPISHRSRFREMMSRPGYSFPSAITELVGEGSQTHNGAFLFLSYGKAAILKRDIVFRGLYTYLEVAKLLDLVQLGEGADGILKDLQARGNRNSLSFIQRLKYDCGVI